MILRGQYLVAKIWQTLLGHNSFGNNLNRIKPLAVMAGMEDKDEPRQSGNFLPDKDGQR